MPSHLSRRLMAACGVVLTLGLAIGCTPEGAPGTGPDHRSMVMPTTGPSPGATVQPSNDNDQQTTVSYQTQVAPLIQNRCAGCHSSASPDGGVTLFDNGGSPRYTDIKSRIVKIVAEVSEGGMPRGRQRLPQSEVQLLETWKMEGSPNN